MPIDGRPDSSHASQTASAQPELDQLRSEMQQLRGEREMLLERQRRIMELIGTTHAEELLHDLRNVLNERNLLRTLTEGQF